MIRSCLSSSLTRLPIAAGFAPRLQTLRTHGRANRITPENPPKCPEIRPDPPPEPPQQIYPPLTCVRERPPSSVRAASEREIPRARGRGEATRWWWWWQRRAKGSPLLLLLGLLRCACYYQGEGKKLFPRGLVGGGRGGGEVTGSLRAPLLPPSRSAGRRGGGF